MKTLYVELGDQRRYPIFIGQDLLSQAEFFTPYIKGSQVCIVTNTTIAPLYLDTLKRTLSDYEVLTVVLPDGEAHKHTQTIETIYDALLSARHNRTTTIVALGGGVVGDMAGFAAATYQRGVRFIQVPTTLLSQVDSSVGGKTGVNHRLGKNMIGAFHQPECVVIDIDVLSTLADRELSAGLAEVIKYGLINDRDFFDWLSEQMPELLKRDSAALIYAIERSCQNKADIVARDEKEASVRALLNLGHTFGHAIETAQGYGTWLHGEAVATGMLMAADLSHRLGWLSQADLTQVRELLMRAHLPVSAPSNMSADDFLSIMAVDKKVIDGVIRLILLHAIGDARVVDDVPQDRLSDTILMHNHT